MKKIEEDIEELRKYLNKLMDNEEHCNKTETLRVSKELDELINKFILAKTNCT